MSVALPLTVSFTQRNYNKLTMNYLTVKPGATTVKIYYKLSDLKNFGKWVLVKRELSNVPCRPGVYLIVNSKNIIVYVGSAKRLAFRLYNHEKNGIGHSKKIYFIEYKNYIKLENKIISKVQPILNKNGVGQNTVIFNDKRYKIQNDRGHIHIVVIKNGLRKKITIKMGPLK